MNKSYKEIAEDIARRLNMGEIIYWKSYDETLKIAPIICDGKHEGMDCDSVVIVPKKIWQNL
jgi:hypothetical protein